MPYVILPLIVMVVLALVWSWWTARAGRDPASSVNSFNRALTAMQPGAAGVSTAPGDLDGPAES